MLRITVWSATVAAYVVLSVPEFKKRVVSPHSITCYVFDGVHLVCGSLLDRFLVDVLVYLIEALVGTPSVAQTGGSCSGGQCFNRGKVLVWHVDE